MRYSNELKAPMVAEYRTGPELRKVEERVRTKLSNYSGLGCLAAMYARLSAPLIS